MPRDVLAGRVFGRLTVTNEYQARKRGRIYWLCECVCGTRKWVTSQALKTPQHVVGSTKSCGCLDREIQRTIHQPGRLVNGKASTTYRCWDAMKQRCGNPKHRAYKRYGGRGISVCSEWANFAAFLSDMGPRPSDQHSIERKDNDGNYCASNCVWATKTEQSRNTSRNRRITFGGRTLCLADWSKLTGIPAPTLAGPRALLHIERALAAEGTR